MGILNFHLNVDLSKAPNAAKMRQQADAVIGAGLEEIGAIFEHTVAVNTPHGATNILSGSIYHEARGIPIREMLVSTPHFYGAIVERGRQPGRFPPRDPIELWVRRVLGVEGKEARSVAFLVARKIARKGTSGAAMFYKGYVQGSPAAERVAQRMGGTIVAEWEK